MAYFRCLLVVPLCLSMTGCIAISYTDADNVRHVVGLVDISLSPAVAEDGATPTAIRMRTFGINAFSNPDASGVIFGYGDATFLTVPNNSCIDLVVMGPCSGADILLPSAVEIGDY